MQIKEEYLFKLDLKIRTHQNERKSRRKQKGKLVSQFLFG